MKQADLDFLKLAAASRGDLFEIFR